MRTGIIISLKNFLKKNLPIPIILILERLRVFAASLAARIKILLHIPLKKKPAKLEFEVNLVERCNLNCKGCMNFSSIVEPEFVSVEEFSRDMIRLGSIFGHECGRLCLIGGEPLLHPEVITLMRTARENFTKGTIVVFTNGILLTKMGAEFWSACHDLDIGITVSAYPINLPIDEIESLVKKYSVKFQYAWGQGSQDRDVFILRPINLAGDGNARVNFGICTRAVNCIALSHGRLFTCTFAPYAHHFNKFFGKNISITEADSVNIYDDLTADEILQKLSEPIPACRYCTFKGRFFEWGISKREISEWV